MFLEHTPVVSVVKNKHGIHSWSWRLVSIRFYTSSSLVSLQSLWYPAVNGFAFCREDENGLQLDSFTRLESTDTNSHKSRAARWLNSPSCDWKVTGLKPMTARETTVVEVPVKREHFLCRRRFFTGVHRCHLDLQPIYLCLCIAYIPVILQASHITYSLFLTSSATLESNYTCKDILNLKNILYMSMMEFCKARCFQGLFRSFCSRGCQVIETK